MILVDFAMISVDFGGFWWFSVYLGGFRWFLVDFSGFWCISVDFVERKALQIADHVQQRPLHIPRETTPCFLVKTWKS